MVKPTNPAQTEKRPVFSAFPERAPLSTTSDHLVPALEAAVAFVAASLLRRLVETWTGAAGSLLPDLAGDLWTAYLCALVVLAWGALLPLVGAPGLVRPGRLALILGAGFVAGGPVLAGLLLVTLALLWRLDPFGCWRTAALGGAFLVLTALALAAHAAQAERFCAPSSGCIWTTRKQTSSSIRLFCV